jgi:hypothetical protein
MVFQKGNTVRLGIQHTNETKLKISKSKKGHSSWNLDKHFSKETKLKISIAKTGQHHSEATKEKIRLAGLNRKHSDETKGKISLANLGENNKHWNGGKFNNHGYVYILKPEHPFADKKGYISEHRLVMEANLRRFLTKDEVIHHIDCNKLNNDINNLMLFANSGEHTRYHNLLKKVS